MAEERLARIEARLDHLTRGQDELRTGQDELRTGLKEVRTGLEEVRAGQLQLRSQVGDLRVHMGVLHEELVDRIKTLAFDPRPLRREFQAGLAGLRSELIQRIEPLEAAIRRKRGPRS